MAIGRDHRTALGASLLIRRRVAIKATRDEYGGEGVHAVSVAKKRQRAARHRGGVVDKQGVARLNFPELRVVAID